MMIRYDETARLIRCAQACALSRRTGRRDICAQPFGCNTPGAFAFITSITYPVFHAKLAAGDSPDAAAEGAWRVAVASNLVQGLIEIMLAAIGPAVQRGVPIVALLTSLSSLGFAFLYQARVSSSSLSLCDTRCLFLQFEP